MAEASPPVNDLQAIAALYEQVDRFLETWFAKDNVTRDQITHKQRINDQAYFVLAWGQLEADIEEVCRKTIRKAQSQNSWQQRRAWSLYNPDSRRLSGLRFKQRLMLVLEKDGDSWNKTMQFYNIRNQIAHGKLRSERIEMSSVIEEFYIIQSSLTR